MLKIDWSEPMNTFFKKQHHHILLPAVIFVLLFLGMTALKAQDENEGVVIDQIVAIVGKGIILESDIENQYFSMKAQQMPLKPKQEMRCSILEDILYQKLMVVQAEYDSLVVNDAQVESELNSRLGMFINQAGSQEALEAYYGKTLTQIKNELRDVIGEQLLAQQVQGNIVNSVSITPSEIKSYYKSLEEDSIPMIKTEYVIGEIVKKPPISVEEKLVVKEKLLDLRKRILAGESFSTLAILYSEDPGSAKKGGELGFYGRGQLYPEFEAVAFKLKEGEVSNVVETEAGYHIIQLIERKGDYVNVRHILLVPKVSPEDLLIARNELDSIVQLIRNNEITFDEAVVKFSDSDDKNNEGLLINQYTGSTTFEADQLDPQVSFTIDKMKVGEISNPVPMKTADQKDAYRILKLKVKTLPHKANMKDDYARIQEWALQDKKLKVIGKWIDEKAKDTYVKIIDEFNYCNYVHKWMDM